MNQFLHLFHLFLNEQITACHKFLIVYFKEWPKIGTACLVLFFPMDMAKIKVIVIHMYSNEIMYFQF